MSKDTNKNSLNDILEDIGKTLEKLNNFIIDKEVENTNIINMLRRTPPASRIVILRNKYYSNSDDIDNAIILFNTIGESLRGKYE